MKDFDSVVSFLEGLSIMPKTMPGLEKVTKALQETVWFKTIDPKKVIVVAGTNGKGTTCAVLESLLVEAGQTVGFYSSPHLVDTTERIRIQKKNIEKTAFIKLFEKNKFLIEKHELTHFEALTLMAADYFFSGDERAPVNYAIFEVGLGGLYDATNAIPHQTSVITALSKDHTNILGDDIVTIAKNKFGIVKSGNVVIHHRLPLVLQDLKKSIQSETNSTWYEAPAISVKKSEGPTYALQSPWGDAPLNLLGRRAAENATTALLTFEKLGFEPKRYLKALSQVIWQGRMQKIDWPEIAAPMYLSGDHNPQGVQSLIELLNDFKYRNIFVVVGIGKDKEAFSMLEDLARLENVKLYLTETPFKGLTISEYPEKFISRSQGRHENFEVLFQEIAKSATDKDLVLVTGSLYLVGAVLRKLRS